MTSGSSFSGVVSPAPHGAQGGAEAFVSSVGPQKPIKRRRLTVLSHNKDATSGVLVGQTAASAGKPAKPAQVDAQAKAMQPPAPKSLYTGVHWNKSKRKWRVRLKTHGRDTHIGYYALEKDAALSYDRYSLHTWGPAPPLNPPRAPLPLPLLPCPMLSPR